MPARRPLADKFWEKVNKTDGCWLWTGSIEPGGYGMMMLTDKSIGLRSSVKVHKISWKLHFGDIPDGLCVCHRCDVPACVRPDHLWLGTHAQNMRDMKEKKRHPGCPQFKGEDNPASKLTVNGVRIIRSRYSSGDCTLQMLASEFGVSFQTISLVVNNKIWKESGNYYR